ncbi:hypothetical protein DFH09DRAFT_1050081, partial [Mycena vulgaris]
MYVEELQSPTFPRSPTESHPSRLPILMVSKDFNRLALPYLYDCVGLTPDGAPLIARQLQHRPELGSFIRYISLSMILFHKMPCLPSFLVLPTRRRSEGAGRNLRFSPAFPPS